MLFEVFLVNKLYYYGVARTPVELSAAEIVHELNTGRFAVAGLFCGCDACLISMDS